MDDFILVFLCERFHFEQFYLFIFEGLLLRRYLRAIFLNLSPQAFDFSLISRVVFSSLLVGPIFALLSHIIALLLQTLDFFVLLPGFLL